MFKLKIVFIFALFFLFCLSPNLNAQIIKDDFRVNDDTTGGNNYDPVVEITESGEVMIVWEDLRNGSYNIYGQSYDNAGLQVGANSKVSTGSGGSYEQDPAISSYHDSLLVIWEYGFAQWLLSDGTQCGSSFYLQSGSVRDPDVTVSDSGFFVAWHRSVSGSGYEIFVKRFDLDGDSINARVLVNDDGGTEAQRDPKIAMDVNGNFVVVWEDYRSSTHYDIYGQLFDASGSKVGSNFLINDDGISSSQYDPSCAMDSAGNFVVVWEDSRNGDYDIYGQRFNPTGDTTGLGGNFLINDDGGFYYQYDPSCGMDLAGNFVVVWGDYRNGNSDIYGQRYDNGGNPQGINFRIDQCPGTEDQYDPKVSMNENNFTVAWEDQRKDRSIYKRRYNNNGTPVGSEMRVNDVDGTKNQHNTVVDMNAAGNVVISWYDERNPYGIYFQRLTANGAPIGVNSWIYYGNAPDVSVAGDGSFVITYQYGQDIKCEMFTPAGDSIGPQITANDTSYNYRYGAFIDMDMPGNFIIAWYDYRNGDSDIYAQRFDSSGDTIDVNFRVNDDVGTTSQYEPVIAVSPSGRFLITWYDYRNGDTDIFGQVYDASGSPVSTNFRIDSDAGTNDQYSPDAAALSDGNFVVAWYDYRSPQGIYAQVIDSLGAPVDTNFKVNDAMGYNPSVSASPTGGFVVTWENYSSPGYDIFAQRYKPDYSSDSSNYKVNNEIEGLNPDQYGPDVATDGTNIIFTWIDPKWQKGYDIAAKVVEWNFTSIDEIKTFTENIRLLPNIPNPFVKSTTIRYSVDKTQEVKIGIYDLTGREVCTLVDGKVGTGVHRVTWNGMSSKGDGVPAGIYFCRLESGSKIQSRKMVLLR
ncbi:T9SS type A sorting domain-containing protein [candidate division WOR-3 bacterium]|nr:T9SS type A sorting domain-containing protein [candidate division WOR-3 bacterium]